MSKRTLILELVVLVGLVLLVLAKPAAAINFNASNASTAEVLVTTSSAVVIASTNYKRSIELQNLGPNAIFCSLNGTAVLNKTRSIAATSGVWQVDIPTGTILRCLAATANQVTGAATILTQTSKN